MPSPHALYVGSVMHARVHPIRHAFRYRTYSLLLDLDHLGDLPSPLRHNRFGLLSFHDRDHGARDGSPLRPWAEARFREGGVEAAGLRLTLLCFPRVLGYVFNPIAVYFAWAADGTLTAVLYQVKNTFGDQHTYVHHGAAGAPLAADHGSRKEFYVSPFLPLRGGYRFHTRPPGERLGLRITFQDGTDHRLETAQTGRRRPLTGATLLRVFLTHPLLPQAVITAIHWEALWLWLKGAPFHARPPHGLGAGGDGAARGQ